MPSLETTRQVVYPVSLFGELLGGLPRSRSVGTHHNYGVGTPDAVARDAARRHTIGAFDAARFPLSLATDVDHVSAAIEEAMRCSGVY